MSTVADILKGARYDLRNYSDIDYDEQLMIHYLDRARELLDYRLIAHNSDWTLNKDDVTLSDGDSTVAVPTGALNIREVWFDQDRKENLDQMSIYYKAQFQSDYYGEPNFWCHLGDYIMFEMAADDDYTVTVFYDKASTALTASTSTMPYNGKFDEALREALVMMVQAKKYKNVSQSDAVYLNLFDSIIQQDCINRKFVKKNYRLDF